MTENVSRQLADLTPEQLAFLSRRLKRAVPQGSRLPRITRVRRESRDFPLASSQRRLWFQERLLPGDPVSNVAILTQVVGHLDRGLFVRAIAEIVRRHEVLRTTFVSTRDEPRQVIAPSMPIPLPEIDLRGLAEAAREPEALRKAAELALQPFDLECGPMLRTLLFLLDEEQSRVLIGFHHIVSDGLAFGIFVQELGAIYRAFHRGEPHGLPEHEIQYVDFAHWQQQVSETDFVARQLAWWKSALAGVPPLLDLPTDRPRPVVLGSRSRKVHLVLSPSQTSDMEALGNRCGANPFMTWLTAFQVFLLRWTAQVDFVVGAPVASRRSEELEGLMGMFVNILPFRSRLSPEAGFRASLGEVREAVLGALANQDLPLERLVEELQLERSLSYSSLYQELFAFQNFRLEAEDLPEVRLVPLDWEVARSYFDLTLFLTTEPRGMLATLRYNLDLLDEATVRRMARSFEVLLRSICEDPERSVADLDLLGEEERQQLQSETGLRVLDECGRQIPAGMVGEVYSGPASDLRPTGELGSVTAGGEIRTLGRKDRRLLVRGFRIQAEAVERPLQLLPGVRDAWVAASADGPLVAWVVADQGIEVGPTLWREGLRQVLPSYQVPATFFTVEHLPRTPSGEVDTAALTAPEVRRSRARAGLPAFVAPRTPIEEQVAAMFRELLKLNEIGVYDGFFELGGHSLLAAQAVGRLAEACRIEMSVPDFFANPTVEGIAAQLEALAGRDGGQPFLPPLERSEERLPASPSPAQERLWFLQRLSPAGTAYNSAFALRIDGPLRPAVLAAVIREIARRHEVLRTHFEEADGRPLAVVSAAPDFSFRVVDLAGLPAAGVELDRLRTAEAQTPFDLARAPLLRILLLRLGPAEHVFVATNHHIVSDGWSTTVFVAEMAALYRACAAGEPSPLPPLPVQYGDYAAWQWRLLREGALALALEHWRAALAGAPPAIDLPLDHLRVASGRRRGAVVGSRLCASRTAELEVFAQQRGATLFMALLALLDAVLWRWSGQDDLVVGTVVANRNPPAVEPLIGCFMNFLPLRCRVLGDQTGSALLAGVRTEVLGSWAYQACPFEKIVEVLSPDRSLNQNPLYNVALLLQNFPPLPEIGEGLRTCVLPQSTGESLLDLRLIASHAPGGGLALEWEYDAGLFEEHTIDLLDRAFQDAAGRLTADPDALLSQWTLPAELEAQAEEARRRAAQRTIVVAASFTAEPLEASLRFWMEALGLSYWIRFAPYDQVFQELLDPASLLARTREGIGVVLVRSEDWIRSGQEDRVRVRGLLSQVRDLASALATAAVRRSGPLLAVLCPSSPGSPSDPERAELLDLAERQLAGALAGMPGVHLIRPSDLTVYEVGEIHDPVAEELGHVPYTPALFAALGTVIARRVHAFATPPRKVVAVDCDGTLWKGVCGEDGPCGVEVDAPRRALQELLVELSRAGLLVCLCSKNNEADVAEVFSERRDMPLGREHVLASRINWRPKPENLRLLAEELGLGLDSFVFLDDSPVECAEVRAGCPEVLVLELPADSGEIPRFLRHVWAFDPRPLTGEDRTRGDLYRHNEERRRSRHEHLSLGEFLAGLDLRVELTEMAPMDVLRVAQLTQRTNQFNLTTIRRTEEEVRHLCAAGELEALVVRVWDRFGEYGLVGVLLFASGAAELRVDTFLLSCRALGRGVEHLMLARLGEMARERGLRHLEVPCRPTARNRPARDFLETVGAGLRDPSDPWLWIFPAESAAGLTWRPEEGVPEAEPASPDERSVPAGAPADSALANRIARELSRIDLLVAAVEQAERQQRPGLPTAFEEPAGVAEQTLAQIWARLLGVEQVGRHDNFFQLGGHSLLATQLLSRVAASLEVRLPLQSVFESPTVAALAERIGRELAHRAGGTQRDQQESPAAPPLRVMPRDRPLPLSFAQQRIWFFERWAPGNAVFNVSTAVEMVGEVRPALFEATLGEITRRHETLRTRFADLGGEPVQVIDPPTPRRIHLADLEALPEAAREAEAGRLAREEARRTFDLERGPLLRVTLVRLSGRRHLTLLTMHHILSDGWSMAVLTGEIGKIYRALSVGRSALLPELPLQYVDFASWQRSWLQGEVLEREMQYWKELLEEAPDSLALPIDRRRGVVQRYRGRRLAVRFPRPLADGLRALALEEKGTSFMAMATSFKALLLRYTHQTDLLLGTLIANRHRRETEELIGCFANALVLRTEVTGGLSFRQALTRVREVTLGAFAHQDMPFEKLVEELNPERQMSLTPLFQVMFILQNTPQATLEIPGLRLTAKEIERGTVNYDLYLSLRESEQGITGSIDYDVDLFDGATVRRLLGHWETVIAAAVAAPDRPLAEAAFLGPVERHQLLVEWNDSRQDQQPTNFLDLFDTHVLRRPEAVVAVCGTDRLTYGELHDRVEKLARSLAARQVVRGQVVPLLTVRGLDFLTTILALFRCGAAYLPLDPFHPSHRIAQILESAGSPLVLVGRASAAALGEALELLGEKSRPAAGILEDLLDEQPTGDSPPAVVPAAQDLAYVLFTSGSTGRPKGVMVEHRGMLNHLRAKIAQLSLSETDHIAQNASQCFDISVWQFLAAPASGGVVQILPDEIAHDPWWLLQEVDRAGITVLEVVPSLLRTLLEEIGRPGAPRPTLARLRWLVPTGEALPSHLCRDWLALYPRIPLINAYGPTECSDDVSHLPISRAFEAGELVASIGRPLCNTRLCILGPDSAPVPIGVAGELHVGGDGVGRGYLQDGARTARAFVPDALSGAAGERLYRTGDLARFLADGRIDFLGRLDHQVKVRGFRIELGEIESVLRQHPLVTEAVVLDWRSGPGADGRLVAYVTQDAHDAASGVEGEDLPEGEPATWHAEQVSQWASIFDDFYAAEKMPEDPTFNIAAWDSSYTGGRIPEPEMLEWLEDTVQRIRSLGPRRVLELGCGTGMLLFRIAPDCQRYLGTDIATQAISYLRRLVGESLPQVELRQRSANEFEGIGQDAFDAVLLNSVVQYFPSIEYLVEVLTGAVEAVAPGGFIFLGDIRSLPLLEAFHTSVELFGAADSLPIEQVRQQVRLRMRQETELVVAPAFFLALPRHLPRIGAVEIHPKRGSCHNELSCFRYQVVLRIGAQPSAAAEVPWSDWLDVGPDLPSLRRHLAEERPERLCFCNVPNQRVTQFVAAVSLMAEDRFIPTVAELRETLARIPSGIDPQDLWDLGREMEYEVDLGWSRPGLQGSFEAVFERRDRNGAGLPLRMSPVLDEEVVLQRWSRYANNPLKGRFASQMVPQLRSFLGGRLPDYMVPLDFVLLDTFPLTRNGKLDYRALPSPELARPDLEARFVPPRTETERRVMDIWQEVLGLRRVGVEDDFFEIGGHSLLATQVLSRLRVAFGVEITLRAFFAALSVRRLSQCIEAALAAAGRVESAIHPSSVGEPPVLSYAQERLWFLDQLEAGSSVYNLPAAVRCSGRLEIPVLERTHDEIVRRHETLRTTFPAVDGQARPVVNPARPQIIPLVDLSGLPEGRDDRERRRLTDEEANRPFDLSRGPVLRIQVIRLQRAEHILLATMHHIASDAWSMWVFVQEVAAIYGAFVHRLPSPLPEPTIQYRDYARWQRGVLEGARLEDLLAHWRARLGGKREVLALPTDRPRLSVQTSRGGLRVMTFSGRLFEALHKLSQVEKVTVFMVLLAGFKTLLYRYTGQEDLSVGSLIANRNRVEIERLIGCFINTLVLRTRLGGGSAFRELLKGVRDVTLDAYASSDLPFEKLVEELRPERDLSHPPLCQVLFVFQNTPSWTLDLPGLTLDVVAPDHAASPFDMAWYFEEREGTFRGTAEYNLDLFDAATIHRMLRQLEALLGDAVRNPARTLEGLSILPESERIQLSTEWNDTGEDFPAKACIHRLIEAAAVGCPDEPAVFARGIAVTYRELDARANRLARHLRGLGVRPETVVGVCMERSVDMVVAIVGVLKAGGAYLPLDPSYPRERLELFLTDSGAPLLLVDGRDPGLTLERGVQMVCLRRDGEAIAQEADGIISDEAGPQNLAYVIYTSGSSGRPKGVLVTHRNLVHSTCARFSYYREPVAGFLLASSFAFDSSVAGIFWTLCTGGTLVLPGEAPQLDLPSFLALFDAVRISHLLCLPALYRVLLEQDEGGRLGALRTVIVAGEACPADLIAMHGESVSKAVLVNEYGPTECSVWSTAAVLEPRHGATQVPIGRPIARSRAHLLDRHLNEVPIGAFAELYVGGAGVARGYLGAPAATAERFLPDPLGSEPGARIYQTGDLTRWLPGGNLELIGRVDQQVKIRGFRIELGEVERALEKHPLVAEGVAVARQEAPGVSRLIGYVVARDGSSLDPAALQAFLRRGLPDYMVPSAVLVLPVLPRTPNGKVDRNALPRVQERRPSLKTPYTVPSTPAEAALATVWEQVLRLDKVGVDDGFSELGGDSILGLQIVGRAGRAGYRFLLKNLFEEQTVRHLARIVEVGAAPVAAVSPAPPFAPPEVAGADVADAYPLSPVQQGILFHSLYTPGSDQYLVETLFAFDGPLDLRALCESWWRVVGRHAALRTRFIWERLEEPIQVVQARMDAVVALIDGAALTAGKDEEWLAGCLRDGRRGRTPDPALGPPARLTVFRLGNASYRLLFSYHHLALDGWSTSLVIGELWTSYREACAGRAVELGAAPPYRRYVDWLREQNLVLAERYFRGLLQGFTAPTALSADRFPGSLPNAETEAGEQEARLSEDLTMALERLARRERLTLSAVVQGAWALLLARCSGTSDVVFGLTSAGRPPDLPGVEEIVGVLIVTVPVRIAVDGASRLIPWLRRLHTQRLEGHAHEHAPLVQVQRWSEVRAGSPLFEYLYVFGNHPDVHQAREGGLQQVRSFDRTHYPLSFEVEPGSALGLRLVHDARRFDRVDILRLLEALDGLLAAIAAGADQELGDLSVLSAAARHQLVLEWSDSRRAPSPGGRGVVHLFAEQVARTPDSVAVWCGDEASTYAELDCRSTALAGRLAGLAVGPDVLVALLAHRGIDFLASVLAVFKAGGAYLPLDPHHPLERTRQILAQSRPLLVLSARDLAKGLTMGGSSRLEMIEKEALTQSEAPVLLPITRHPSHLAYVIYTSGSTGVPKGAMVEHRGMVNHLWAKIEELELTGGDVVAQNASQCFDISVWQLLAALLVGGRVHIFPDEVTRDPIRLLDEVAAAGITVFETVPSLLRLMTDEVEARGSGRPVLAAMRWLIPTGEALLAEDCRRWLALYPEIALLNAYGPTECSDDVAHWTIRGLPDESLSTVPIGRPVRNTRLHVLGAGMRPTPAGVPGELLVGGEGVGRGYLGDGARTAAAFVPDPFGWTPGARLYRTGDRARCRADGALEFLGRIDDQVKIRGFRIELGEIETVLRSLPGIRQAVVLDRELGPGDRRLLAWVVGERQATLDADELRSFLKGRLPDYMVPSVFVVLGSLPLTPSGKIDRQALPSPTATAAGRAGSREAPRSEIERKIADVWCEVLRLDYVGVEENFFDLGGHSLLIVQVYSLLRKTFETDLAVVDLFKHPTVSGLAARLSGGAAGSDAVSDRSARGGQRRELSERRRQFVQEKRGVRRR